MEFNSLNMGNQKTKDKEKSKNIGASEVTDDITDVAGNVAKNTGTEAVPSWSEIGQKVGANGAKKATIAYLLGGAAIFAGSMFTLPFTIGFPFAILVLGLFSGLIGKSNLMGVGVAGILGGAGGALFTGGLTALFTFIPILAGAFGGMIAGIVGVVVGSYIVKKIKS